MKVILRENVENLGRVGDLVRVSDGYARNYLLPRNLVVMADEENVKAMEHHQRALSKKRLREQGSAQDIAKRLENFTCTISRRAGEGDRLFGSVTANDVAQVLQQEGIKVEKRQIVLDEPIKQLGEFNVSIKLHPEITSSLKVSIIAATS